MARSSTKVLSTLSAQNKTLTEAPRPSVSQRASLPVVYTSPMQKKLDDTVKKLAGDIKISDELKHYDLAIFAKYGIKKFEIKLGEERVEAWLYDQNSLQLPIIEDQAIKRGQSLVAAAKHIFMNQGLAENIHLLEQLEKDYIAIIAKESERLTQAKADELINMLINDIAYRWGRSHPKVDELKEADYKGFYNELWHETETPPYAAYKTSHILVLNTDEHVRSVQFYERGTRSLTDEKAKEYRSAHKRDGVGVPNFIAYGTGHLDEKGDPVVTDIGFRHASLVPIDLYKEDKTKDSSVKEKKESDAQSLLVQEITTENMLLLASEMRARMTTADEKEDKVPNYWINVSLLTATENSLLDREDQTQQYRDTILAADRIRARQGIVPVMFDFGVNTGATTLGLYTSDQAFENRRAFFQLQKMFLSTFDNMSGLPPTIKSYMEKYKGKLSKMIDHFDNTIEKELEKKYQAYDQACLVYKMAEEKDKPTAREKVFFCKNELEQVKKGMHGVSEKMIEQLLLLEPEKDLLKFLSDEVPRLPKATSKEELAKRFNMISALSDMSNINLHFLNTQWKDSDKRFDLQAYIVDLGKCLGRLNSFEKNPVARVTTSFNCKSNNDRSQIMAIKVDQLRLRRFHGGPAHCDFGRHACGGAWAQSPIIDTDGGGPKYKGRHPNKDFATAQYATSDWAGHKKGKQSYGVPQGLQIKSPDSQMQEFKKLHESLSSVDKKHSEPMLLLLNKNLVPLSTGILAQRAALFCELIQSYFSHISSSELEDKQKNAISDALVAILKVQFSSSPKVSVTIAESPSVRLSVIGDFKDQRVTVTSVSGATKTPIDPKLASDVKDYKLYTAAMKAGRGLKWDSTSTKNISRTYGEYCNKMHTPQEALILLGDLAKLISAWLDKKHGKKRTKDNRVETLRALQAHIDGEIAKITAAIDLPKKLHMDVIEAFKSQNYKGAFDLLNPKATQAATIKSLSA